MWTRVLGFRGGVLEPEGTVEIKFKKRDIIKTMKRLDVQYASLTEKLGSGNPTPAEKVSNDSALHIQHVVYFTYTTCGLLYIYNM